MDTDLLIQLESICRKAGEFQLSHFGKISRSEISDKGLNQLVSFVDIESEKLLVKELEKLYPGCAFITEEGTGIGNEQSDMSWIIDPLDGTTNFLHGIGAFSISVALYKSQKPLLGVVYIPVWDEMFSAEAGKGATLNGHKIQISNPVKLKETLIATGFPYYEFQNMLGYLSALKQLMESTQGLRRMGSAAIDLAYTACGRFDGFYESGLSAWDVAAGALLVMEAGGEVTDFKSGEDFLFGKSIIASSKSIYPEFQKIISNHLVI